MSLNACTHSHMCLYVTFQYLTHMYYRYFFMGAFLEFFFNAILDVIDAVKVDWSRVVIKLMHLQHKIILLGNLKMKCMLIYL